MEHDYRNIISHIDVDRSLDSIEYSAFSGIDEDSIADFKDDFEAGNDSIELHLIKSKAYKEVLILKLAKSNGVSGDWRELLKEEQKTFGGSKIFYVSKDCGRLLLLSLPNEMPNKLNMLVTRLNKINEKISRINSKIKKENLDLYSSKMKEKDTNNRKKDEIANFINLNLRV